jgi:site-specific recombinase XerD
MFERLFTRPKALARQRTGPLLDERCAYLTHLAGQGAARRTLRVVACYLLDAAHFLRLSQRPGETISADEIQEQATCWANVPTQQRSIPPSPSARPRFIRFTTRWLRFMGRLQQPSPQPTPYDAWITAFTGHLQHEKGLSKKTISTYRRYLLDFLQRLAVPPQAFAQVTIAQLEEPLMQKFAEAGYARNTVRHYGEALRDFFRYAQTQGWCRPGLAEGILLPRIYQQEGLPSGPSWEVVQRLIARASGNHPRDIRARALLVLLATYALRAGEVASLLLEDFDWEHEILVVTRSKSRRRQAYPLCRTVGDAVLRYLREARPRSLHRQVFLLCRSPYTPLSSAALTGLVARRFLELGMKPPRCGPHALRHACATHLLECGLSLKEIGDHLGHLHPDTTRIYAKVDVPQLRRVADIDLGGLL